jgi:DNA-binding SARP family transcriptional activator
MHMQRLLAFLALQGRPLHRAYVAGRLWIELNQEHAHGCLRSTLWRMSHFPSRVVDVTSTHVALAPGVAVDARELESSAERVLHDGGPPAAEDGDCLTQAADLLPDWYEDWVLQERERLRQLRLLALEAAGNGLIGARRYSEATIVALAAVASDPLRESAYRLLIRSYLAEGNVAEALRQFGLFRAQLRNDLGLEPSPQLQALIQEVS